jgi:spore coat protein CotH
LAGCGDSSEGGAVASLLAPAPGGAPPPPAGDQSALVFNENELNDFHLTMSAADWESIIQDTMGDTYRHAGFRWKGVTLNDVGVRPVGSATRFPGNVKMSLKLDFNVFVPGQKFLGLKSLKLDGLYERTMLRESLSYYVFRTRLPATPRTAYCRLFVNGELRGVYMAEERVTSDFVKNRFGGTVGNAYRMRVDRPEAFTYRGADPALYLPEPWQPATNETDGDHSVIPRFLDVLNNRPAELETVCDLENLTDYLAMEAAVISYDGVLRDAGPPHNMFTYHRPETGRFMLIPWDVDQTWTSSMVTRGIFHNFDNTKIAAVVRDTPALQALYWRKIAETIETASHPDRVAARLDWVYAHIRDAVYADPYKRITNSEFDGYVESIKRTARARYDFLRSQVQ